MPSLVVLGAGGFLGNSLLGLDNVPWRAIAVGRGEAPARALRHAEWRRADLLAPRSLDAVVGSGDVVVNLAYMTDAGPEANKTLALNIAESCSRAGVSRLIHCSTAVVAGATQERVVNEKTACVPVTEYEKTKLAVEEIILTRSVGVDVGILRPTAIVGPGGKNLVKLAASLSGGNRIANYSRSALFGTRPMHLVPVRNVAAAILHLATMPGRLNGDIYIVASDRDPDNNFKSVEGILRRSLGVKPRGIPVLPVPRALLTALLGVRGRSETDTSRVYDSSKLASTGFVGPDSVAGAVAQFAASLMKSDS